MGQQGHRPKYFRQSLVGNKDIMGTTTLKSGPIWLVPSGPRSNMPTGPTRNPSKKKQKQFQKVYKENLL
jgi:hypothetical protein